MITINRGQALAIWSTMADLGVDVQLKIFEQRGDGEIWAEAVSEGFGSRVVALAPSGGVRFPAEPVQEDASRPEGVESGREGDSVPENALASGELE